MLIDPKEALFALLCKWVLIGLKPRESNQKTLLRHKLAHYSPSRHMKWSPYLNWMMVQGQTSTPSLGTDNEIM
jgi:hypothetical protein